MSKSVSYARPIVVLVDDDPAILRSYARLLRREPYDVLTFDDPGKALAWMETAEVDLVLTDQRMPAMSGSELLDVMNRRSPRTRGAIITGDPAGGSVPRSARALIAKPWDNQQLRGTIRDLLSDPKPWIDGRQGEPGASGSEMGGPLPRRG
jgi:DNA-binding NtrC family response regulator